ncbi:aminotransferase class V-fold PLP-dependent enzyme [candidate division KSB1 bacterium]|nr:aminotransferase class V-fold PLP-dependent enzyme [candidate division KSB1 bacterium]
MTCYSTLWRNIMPGPGSYWIGDEEKHQIDEVMATGYLSRYGRLEDPRFKQKVYTFEKELADYCNVNHALATSSGTGSIMIALLALGIKPGDEVIVPAYTFVATYSAVIFAGAVPVLTEIDKSLNMDPSQIEEKITPKTKAIIPVHMLGNPCDMHAIMRIAEKHHLAVLEDACQAAGASFQQKKVGSIGHMGAFSLNIFKTITAGDGGAVVTNDVDLYERAFGLHDQGHKPLRAGLEIGARSILGLNFRVNELVGALALAQLHKIDRITSTLRQKKNKLKAMISDIEGVTFRKINDSEGECATLCTVIFEDAQKAALVADLLDTTTVDKSGWHVYANMEHINRYLKEKGQPYGKGAYPITDDLLSRSINLSVGVVDAGLGSGFGIHINSTDKEIEIMAGQFICACNKVEQRSL